MNRLRAALQALRSTVGSKPCSFPWLWRNFQVVESLWGQHPYSQQTDMQQGCEGLGVDSTALSWSSSPWDGQTTRWGAKLAPCHPQVSRAQMASLLPHPHWPQSHTPINPPSTMSSCSPSAAALLRLHWAGSCETLLFLSQNVLQFPLWVISLSQV